MRKASKLRLYPLRLWVSYRQPSWESEASTRAVWEAEFLVPGMPKVSCTPSHQVLMPGNLSALPAPGLFQLITMRKSWTNTAQGFCEQGKVTTQNQDNKRQYFKWQPESWNSFPTSNLIPSPVSQQSWLQSIPFYYSLLNHVISYQYDYNSFFIDSPLLTSPHWYPCSKNFHV